MKAVIIFALLMIVAFAAFNAGVKCMLNHLRDKYPAAYAVFRYEFDTREREGKEAKE